MTLERPIPAFYCCYLLRSTVRHSSVYIGSTPHPVRRLRQHNGLAKGGAVRTARQSLRPWEMACIVTGFPSHIAALQFEWAWQNPHITQHIASEERIQHATHKKRSGHPKRPRHSVTSLLSNLHVLLRSPSFTRWPLEIRFFSKDVHIAWLKWVKATRESIRTSIPIVEDFPPTGEILSGDDIISSPRSKKRKLDHGIDTLPIDYANQKAHVEKAKEIIDFEREGKCKICSVDLEHSGGLFAVCPETGCETVSHLTCLSKHFLGDDEDALVPITGKCPGCETELIWADVVKELTLRTRGQKEVQKLLKAKRVRKAKAGTASQPVIESSDIGESSDSDGLDLDLDDDVALKRIVNNNLDPDTGDNWHIIDDSNISEAESVMSKSSRTSTQSKRKPSPKKPKAVKLKTVIEDSWDEAEVLE